MLKVNEKTINYLKGIITGDSEKSKYWNGPNLVRFFNSFGFNDEYGPGFGSRWAYALNKLNELNESGKISLVIEEYYNPNRWIEKENELKILIEDVNKYLAFDGYFLENNGIESSLKELNNSKNKKIGFFSKVWNKTKSIFGDYEVSEVDLKLIKIKKKSNK